MPEQNWNSFNTKELALNIGKEAAASGIEAMAIGTGLVMAQRAMQGEKIEAEETVETALRIGTDTWVKEATAGALKVGVERDIIRVIPKETPIGILTTIACVGIEDTKILVKVAQGDLTLSEGIDNIAKTTVAMTYGLSWSAKGAAIGAGALSWIPVVGPVVGGLAGGIVGYAAGSKFGQTLVKGAKKVGGIAVRGCQKVARGIAGGVKVVGSGVSRVASAVGSGVSRIASAVGGFFGR
jgi:hypothetical protein